MINFVITVYDAVCTELSWHQTIDKVGQLLGRGLVSKDNQPMKCTTSKLITCQVTNGGPIWSAFYVVWQSKKQSNIKASVSLSSAIFWRHNHDVTSDTCHGSTISSADCVWKLNHAQKVGQLYRSSDAGIILFNIGYIYIYFWQQHNLLHRWPTCETATLQFKKTEVRGVSRTLFSCENLVSTAYEFSRSWRQTSTTHAPGFL